MKKSLGTDRTIRNVVFSVVMLTVLIAGCGATAPPLGKEDCRTVAEAVLFNLRTAQSVYHLETGLYTDNVTELIRKAGYIPHPVARLRLLDADNQNWRAEAWYPQCEAGLIYDSSKADP